ncbi:hypothetical protein C7212DRAFT_329035 [Tuber magnatum]|uniref:Uncharacterized protein n=1 Tax=Tuber magnatum TaxID=42249 RepID=A0A317SL06_9PEZI|nr:hypothetical protein C7212DRAFT_329035 [Tuber magnatum]
METKPSNHIQQISTRKDADKQSVRELKSFLIASESTTLYGISALGTRLCVYTTQQRNGDIEPEAIVENPARITDTTPAGCWSIDILEPEGGKRVREVVVYINAMCPELC